MNDSRVSHRLKFSKSNDQAKLRNIAKWLKRKVIIYSFSMPSGHTCPFAHICMSKANRDTGKITDGKFTTIRCFSATTEAMSPTARAQRWHNFDILRHLDYAQMVDVLQQSLPTDCDICRVHIGGDFFNQKYFDAWMEVARLNPGKLFYAYTKSIPYWTARLDSIPSNFILTGSRGGRADNLLDTHGLKVAEIVFSLEEAEEKGLEIDHDESHAIQNTGSFALLIHGTQPKGSEASQAIKELKANNVQFSYSRK